MAKQTVALAMIVKGTDDEAPLLAKCLASVARHVDAIYINLNHAKGENISQKVRKVAEQYTTKIYVTEWENNFVKARNFIYGKVPKKYDWIMWLDADDTVINPAKIRDVINIASDAIFGVYVPYDYAHDEYGNCTMTHWICRVSRNDDAYAWQSSIDDGGEAVHETLVATRTVDKARNEEFRIKHGSNPDRRVNSLLRNIKLLEGMYERQMAKKEVDPRVLYYLATHYYDATRIVEAQDLLMEYLKVSGWAEERSEAWVYLGLIFQRLQREDAARQAFVHAIAENPKNPRPYIELGELEFRAKRYVMSEEWLLTGINKKLPETTYVVFPMENKYRAYMLLTQTYINMGASKINKAAKYVNLALELRPTDPDAKEAQRLVEKLQKVRKRTQAVARIASYLKEEEQEKNIVPFLDLLPNDFQDNPAVVTLRQNFQKPKKWGKNTMAIFCGNSAEDIWGPWGLNEGGMGGSEEAVIQMSRELSKLGWAVTVYATPGSKAGPDTAWDESWKDDYGLPVIWKSYWEFNPKDIFDVFVAWRMPWFFDVPIKARKNVLWMHDVMDKAEFTKRRVSNIDHVIFVSKYHADLYKDVIPASKRTASGNGIDPRQFEKYDGKFERNTYRCIYMSSQVRGLEELLDIWEDVRKEVPDATLDVYYGNKTFINSNKDNPERMKWLEDIEKRMKSLPGVTDRGRVGHDEIAKEIQKSGVLAYPCKFPEVYNISTVKAIAGGAYPVLSDFGCLPDYKDYSTQIYLGKNKEKFVKEYKKALIDALKNPIKEDKRRANMLAAREKFTWTATAEGWNKVLA